MLKFCKSQALLLSAVLVFPLFAFNACAGNAAIGVEAQQDSAPHQLQIMVDPRVELMSLIFRLAGNFEYNMAKVDSYAADAERQFGAFTDHAAIKMAAKLREEHGVGFDAVMGMAIHLTDVETLELKVPLSPWPESLDDRWKGSDVSNFLAAARQFAKDADFPKFLREHQSLYQTTRERMQAFLAREGHLEWFDQYLGRRPAQFTVVPGLLNGGGCYGPHFHATDGHDDYFCILGVWKTDDKGLPQFERDAIETVVHEFCHSYANPLVYRHFDQLGAAGDQLFEQAPVKMRAQAYSSGKTVLCESMVRVCVIRYILKYQGEEAAKKAINGEIRHGFAWMGDLSNLMAEYETHRDKFPTLEEFTPRLVEFFGTAARNTNNTSKEADARLPKIVSIIPANGAQDVDPALKEIKVTFDRQMTDNSWSMVGGGEHFPETGKGAHYDAARKVWTIPVELKPDWQYEFMLNSGDYTGFRSADGHALDSVEVTFKTAPAQK